MPIQYPTISGPGRLLEICSFRKGDIPESKVCTSPRQDYDRLANVLKFQEIFSGLMQKISTFGIASQNLFGTDEGDECQAVLVADWISAEDKNVFATSKRSALKFDTAFRG